MYVAFDPTYMRTVRTYGSTASVVVLVHVECVHLHIKMFMPLPM